MSPIIYIAIPLFLITMMIEYQLLKKRHDLKGYERQDSAASLTMGIGNVLIAGASKGLVIALSFWLYENFALFADFLNSSHWWTWLLLFFADDFCYYCFHRFGHRTRMGWAAHVNHHSSQHYNLSTALRQSWTTPFFHWIFYLPLPILGFHPVAVLTMQALSLLYQYWIHTEIITRLGPLEQVLNTPSHHRVHHGSNDRYLDKNYGGFLIIYDKLFGSFEPEREPVKYGLTSDINTFNPLKIAAHEWMNLATEIKHSTSIWQAIKRPFMPPGWQPTGQKPYFSDES